jgi:hypothetical protein
MRLLKRLLQRLLIFGLGIFCVWLIVFVVFETADRRLPWILAVGVTYGIAAYIVLPRAIRTPPPHLAPSIFSGAVRTSAFKRQSMTARGSAIT